MTSAEREKEAAAKAVGKVVATEGGAMAAVELVEEVTEGEATAGGRWRWG